MTIRTERIGDLDPIQEQRYRNLMTTPITIQPAQHRLQHIRRQRRHIHTLKIRRDHTNIIPKGCDREAGWRENGAMAATPSISWTTLTIDCADAEVLGAFYSAVLGWEVTGRDGSGWLQLRNPAGGIGLNIQAEETYEPPVWPEQPGRQAKMMHFEILVDDLEAAVRSVLDSGGSEAAHQPPDRDRTRLRIMLDPAGHPLCLFVDGE